MVQLQVEALRDEAAYNLVSIPQMVQLQGKADLMTSLKSEVSIPQMVQLQVDPEQVEWFSFKFQSHKWYNYK